MSDIFILESTYVEFASEYYLEQFFVIIGEEVIKNKGYAVDFYHD